jgi:DNA repair exonuclease SbcCD nuclease subunit
MTQYTLFTDPHLGTRRAAHTTRESAKKLTQALFDQALTIAENGYNPICLGDLFDRACNEEAILVQGFQVSSNCLWTLAGNHDSTNREGTVTSLDALKALHCPIVSSPDLSTPYHLYLGDGIFMVPHHASQELFETALFHAAEHAAHDRGGKASVLMLHCNYDAPDFMQVEDDTLNLSAEVAERLLNAFDYILLGHEHRPATFFDGRVVILGNTHPTSFSDISDKFSYVLDIGDGHVSIEPELIWSQERGFREIRYGDPVPDLSGVQFVSVFGIAEAEQSVAVADFVQEVWSAGADLLAVRNNVMIGQAFNEVQEPGESKLGDLKTHIAAELQGTDLADLFSTLAAEVSA